MYRVTNLSGVDRHVRLNNGRSEVIKEGKSKVVDMKPMSDFIIQKWRRAGLRIDPEDAPRPDTSPLHVDIPDDWQQMSAAEKKELAAKLGNKQPATAAEATVIIEDAIVARQEDYDNTGPAADERLIGKPLTSEKPA